MGKDASNWSIEQHLSYTRGVVEGLFLGSVLSAGAIIASYGIWKAIKSYKEVDSYSKTSYGNGNSKRTT